MPRTKNPERFNPDGSPRKLYHIWTGMRSRCRNPKARRFARYGGRGIQVCERWQTFSNFAADMGDPPDGTSLERINRDGDYEPGNCIWADIYQQNNNKCDNRVITYEGRSLTVAQWSRELEISQHSLYNRLRQGWPPHDVLGKPLRVPAVYEIDGECHTVKEWCRIRGVHISTVRARMRRGVSFEEALCPQPPRRKQRRTLVEFEGRSISLWRWCRIHGVPPNTIRGRLDRGWPLEKALAWGPAA